MKRIFVPVLIVLAAAPTAAALDRAQVQALVGIAEKASGITARSQVRVVAEPPARFAQRRTRLLDRAYPRRAQAHDETVYRALGWRPQVPARCGRRCSRSSGAGPSTTCGRESRMSEQARASARMRCP